MLMQNFKSADDLDITEKQKDALIKTLVLLETGKIRHVPEDELCRANYVKKAHPKYDGLFNMSHTYAVRDCGTIACIKGTAELIGNVWFDRPEIMPEAITNLFYNWGRGDPDTAQAATALRNYLTTGDAQWDVIMKE